MLCTQINRLIQMAMVDGEDNEGGRGKRMNQDRICWRAVFSVWSEIAVDARGEVLVSS